MGDSELPSGLPAFAVVASVFFVTVVLDTHPAEAQRNPLAGRWSCSQAVHNTRNNFRSLSQYILVLYPNGRFLCCRFACMENLSF